MSEQPDWWKSAEAEIDGIMVGFTEGLKRKLVELGNQPMSLLRRKNPFLLRIRGREDVSGFVWSMVDALLSSSEETKFGNIFEQCAEIVCRYGRNGWKSGIEGIDLEYSVGTGKRVLVQIKSGKSWGNSSQRKQLKLDFERASRILLQGSSLKDVRCIEGIAYGKREQKYLSSHERIVGATFWEEISGWDDLYFALMTTVGKCAGNGLQNAKEKTVGKIVHFMREKNLLENGNNIHWEKLISFLDAN